MKFIWGDREFWVIEIWGRSKRFLNLRFFYTGIKEEVFTFLVDVLFVREGLENDI